MDLHRRLPGYQPTPLHRLTKPAARLGVGELYVKDESNRLGLPSFKILGASWAVYRTLTERIGDDLQAWSSLDDLRDQVQPLLPLTLTTATDGNHGRAVARMAAMLGLKALIFVPCDMVPARIRAIESEGARVVIVEGTYDDAVTRATEAQNDSTLAIPDVARPGDGQIPLWVIEGYSTIYSEIDDALKASNLPGPDFAAVQIGVGSFAASAVTHYCRPGVTPRPRMLGVEPTRAACALAAYQSGRIVTIPGPYKSIMAGLNCGTVSSISWPMLRDGIDAFITVEDDRARQAMRLLADEGIASGASGSAGLAGLLELLDRRTDDPLRQRLGIDNQTRVLVILTEGITNPDADKP